MNLIDSTRYRSSRSSHVDDAYEPKQKLDSLSSTVGQCGYHAYFVPGGNEVRNMIGLFVDGVTAPRHQSNGTNRGLLET